MKLFVLFALVAVAACQYVPGSDKEAQIVKNLYEAAVDNSFVTDVETSNGILVKAYGESLPGPRAGDGHLAPERQLPVRRARRPDDPRRMGGRREGLPRHLGRHSRGSRRPGGRHRRAAVLDGRRATGRVGTDSRRRAGIDTKERPPGLEM
ncbi:hypothetical protein FJT64_004811 [Amphibalanus amphitrite]|uniref:Uncharacterized protein n=1 Tax=Amphibalanus amphitrite TaxID=1232801 RepID=A0A6A4W6W4_AMPAM|nr:hypothetical protein FJT64_004811 [Amphibalanus amphitrite]